MKRISSIKSNLTRSKLEGNRLYTEDMFCEDLYNFAKSLEDNKLLVVDPDIIEGLPCDYVSVTAITTYDGKTFARRFPNMLQTIGYNVPHASGSKVYIPRCPRVLSEGKVVYLINSILECCVFEGIITRSEFYNIFNNYILIY